MFSSISTQQALSNPPVRAPHRSVCRPRTRGARGCCSAHRGSKVCAVLLVPVLGPDPRLRLAQAVPDLPLQGLEEDGVINAVLL